MRQMFKWTGIFTLLLVFAFSITEVALAVPNLIDFQGSLTDGSGNPVSGEKQITFRLYSVNTGGTSLWTEVQNVVVTSGIYSTALGATAQFPNSVWDNSQLWIGIQVGTDQEMSPRIRIVAVPYCLRAKEAETVSSGTVSSLPSGTMMISMNPSDNALIAMGFVPTSRIALQTLNAWSPMSMTGAPTSFGKAVEANGKMIVMGGMPTPVGGIYDPIANAWSSMSMTGAPNVDFNNPIGSAQVVVTNGKVIVMGNTTSPVGGIYDPIANAWSPMSMTGAPNVDFNNSTTQVVAVNGKVIVMGSMPTLAGGIYDPIADAWSSLSMKGAIISGKVVVTNGKVIVMGNTTSPVGGIYDPIANAWSPMSMTGAPTSFGKAVEANGKVIVMGNTTSPVGGIYDPIADAWSPMSMTGAPNVDFNNSTTQVVAVNGKVIVMGSMPTLAGGIYDPIADAWSSLSMKGAIISGKVVAANGKVIVMGSSMTNPFLGGIYDPIANVWRSISTTGAPNVDFNNPIGSAQVVVTNGKVIVMGSSMTNPFLGGIYDPIADAWSPMSMTGAPSITSISASVGVTGTKVIVVGSSMAVLVGGIYDTTKDNAFYYLYNKQ